MLQVKKFYFDYGGSRLFQELCTCTQTFRASYFIRLKSSKPRLLRVGKDSTILLRWLKFVKLKETGCMIMMAFKLN